MVRERSEDDRADPAAPGIRQDARADESTAQVRAVSHAGAQDDAVLLGDEQKPSPGSPWRASRTPVIARSPGAITMRTFRQLSRSASDPAIRSEITAFTLRGVTVRGS
jgi:hypothetical protein